MLHFLSKNKLCPILWFVLCMAISLSCLLPISLSLTKNSQYPDTSSLLDSQSSKESYPDIIHEDFSRGHNLFINSCNAKNNRIPLRLPIPHIWIPFTLLFGNYLLLQGNKQRKENENVFSFRHIIRYIHDQNGETYHPFLF